MLWDSCGLTIHFGCSLSRPRFAGEMRVRYSTRGCCFLVLSIHRSMSDIFFSSQSVQSACILRSQRHGPPQQSLAGKRSNPRITSRKCPKGCSAIQSLPKAAPAHQAEPYRYPEPGPDP